MTDVPDDYANLGPAMKARLDLAEDTVQKVRRWVDLTADRGPAPVLVARELCLVLGWPDPDRSSERTAH